MVAHTLKEVRRAEVAGIDSWIQEILDPKRDIPRPMLGPEAPPKPHRYPAKCGETANI